MFNEEKKLNTAFLNSLLSFVYFLVQITQENQEGSYVYALQANVGMLTQTNPQARAPRLCDPMDVNAGHQFFQLTSAPFNVSWIFKSIPEVETPLTLRYCFFS